MCLISGTDFPVGRCPHNAPLSRNHDKLSIILFRFNIAKSVVVSVADLNENKPEQLTTYGNFEVAI